MKEVLSNFILAALLFPVFFAGCAATTPTTETIQPIAGEENIIAGDRIYFPGCNLSLRRPPGEWEMQQNLGEGELVLWVNRETGSVFEIMVSRSARNLSYHNIAVEFNRNTCEMIQQNLSAITCTIADEENVNFNGRQFYRFKIIYQGLFSDFFVKSIVYLHRNVNFVYHFLFMEEKYSLLANELMQSVVFYDFPQKNMMSANKAAPMSLIDACYYGDTGTVETLLAAGANSNTSNEAGVAALSYASDRGHMDIVKILLANNADVNTRSNIGCTPLMNAAYMGHVKIVNILIDSGAEVNAQSDNGTTALMNAAANGYTEIVKILLAHDADMDVCEECGLNALWNAISSGHEDIAKVLIDGGADVNIRANDGTTALMNAAFIGNIDIVRMLLEAGAEINAKAETGWTALMLAKRKGYGEIVRLLIDYGAMEDSIIRFSL